MATAGEPSHGYDMTPDAAGPSTAPFGLEFVAGGSAPHDIKNVTVADSNAARMCPPSALQTTTGHRRFPSRAGLRTLGGPLASLPGRDLEPLRRRVSALWWQSMIAKAFRSARVMDIGVASDASVRRKL